MSILYDDYIGKNKENWQRKASEFILIVKKLYDDNIIYLDHTGVALWKTSNKVIPEGYAEALKILGIPFDYKKTVLLRRTGLNLRQYKTNFKRDLKSDDIFWRRNAFYEAVKIQQDYIKGVLYLDTHGIARWNTNNRVIPRECLEQLAYSGVCPRIYFDKNDKAREIQTNKILENYLNNNVSKQ